MKLDEAKQILKKAGYITEARNSSLEEIIHRIHTELWKKDPKAVLKGDASRPSNDDRAEDDSDYMGYSYDEYDLDDPCGDEEWAEAGRQWAKDMLKSGNYSKRDYRDAMQHYRVYEFEDDWEPSDED